MPLLELLQAGQSPFGARFHRQMGRNSLTNLEGVARLPCLQSLDISSNKLESLQAPWNEMVGPSDGLKPWQNPRPQAVFAPRATLSVGTSPVS